MFWSIVKVTENTIAGNTVILLRGNRREMTTKTEYHAADTLARGILPGARLIDTGESIDGYPQRRYYADAAPVALS